jgi:hypothetical protein
MRNGFAGRWMDCSPWPLTDRPSLYTSAICSFCQPNPQALIDSSPILRANSAVLDPHPSSPELSRRKEDAEVRKNSKLFLHLIRRGVLVRYTMNLE